VKRETTAWTSGREWDSIAALLVVIESYEEDDD
jgi:hypothetical protein